MAELFNSIFAFFTNKGLHIGYKLSLAILVIFSALLVNDYFGFSRGYLLDSRLDQIIKLKQIDPQILTHDSVVNRKYLKVKEEVINERSVTEEVIGFIKNLSGNKHGPVPNVKVKNAFWLDISAMAYFYFAIIVFIFTLIWIIFKKYEVSKDKVSTIAGLIMFMVAAYFVGKLYKLLVSSIPVIYGYEWINYSLYFAVPFVITAAIIVWKTKIAESKKGLYPAAATSVETGAGV